jgi:hypothetical protein
MLKNITFSTDEKIIDTARKKALNNKTTLNALFNKWLSGYVKIDHAYNHLDSFLNKVSYASSGKSFSRKELNER